MLAGGLVFARSLRLTPVRAGLERTHSLPTMGFRQFSHYYTDIQLALRMQDLPRARQLLGEWRGQSRPKGCPRAMSPDCPSRRRLASSHRHVFGVLLWFVLLPGPCGAMLYRAAAVFRSTGAARILIPWHPVSGDFAAGVCSDRLVAFCGRRRQPLPLSAISRMPSIAGARRPETGPDDEIGIVLASVLGHWAYVWACR